jgi:hypothetical protein
MPDESTLINEIHRLKEELGRPPRYNDIDIKGKFSYQDYKDQWGSWTQAMKAAELGEHVRETPDDDEDLLEEMRRLADELGKTPTQTDMDENGRYSLSSYRISFGDWNEAVKSAGLEPYSVPASPDRDFLLDELHRVADELGETPTMREMAEKGKFTSSPYETEFGTWNNALETAGFEPNLRRNISDDNLLEEMRRLADELGRTPTGEEMEEQGRYSTNVYETRFGSWSETVKEAGLEPKKGRKKISEEDLTDELQRLADELGHKPGFNEMNELGKYSVRTYRRNFETWNKAIEMAGFEPNEKKTKFPDKNLLDEIRSLADELGRTPTSEEMEEQGAYSTTTYVNHFGSWTQSIEVAGLEPNVRKNITDGDLLDEIRRLTGELEREIKTTDMREQGRYSLSLYYDRFGSWAEAKEIALNSGGY